MQRQDIANQYTHIRPNYVVIYLTSLNIFLGSFKHVFNCTGWVANSWNKSLDSSYALWAEHPGLQRINLDQRFFLWNKPKDDKREQAVSLWDGEE